MTANQQQNQTKPGFQNGKFQDEDTIDLLELAKELLKHWFMIGLATVVVGVLAFVYSKILITPQYESTSTMYILTKETTLTSLADLQIGTQLTNDYQVVVTTRTVLQNTLDELGLSEDMTYQDLKKRITITNPQNTRMLQITAEYPDPKTAKAIADTVAKNASDFIADTMEITPPKIIETGVVPEKKSKPSNSKNALIGALLGFVISAGFVTVKFLMNDAVTTEEDVQKYLNLSVLASLPDRSENEGGKERKNRLKQSRRKS